MKDILDVPMTYRRERQLEFTLTLLEIGTGSVYHPQQWTNHNWSDRETWFVFLLLHFDRVDRFDGSVGRRSTQQHFYASFI